MTTVVRFDFAFPPEQFGRWDPSSSGDILADESDGTWLTATPEPGSDPPRWSAGDSRSYQAFPIVPDDDPATAILAVRTVFRARFDDPEDEGFIWHGNLLSTGMTERVTVEPGSDWQQVATRWRRTQPNGRPWTPSRLRGYLNYLGRTVNTGPMLISQAWLEVEKAATPAPEVTGPVSPVSGTSSPDVRWKVEDGVEQAGYQIEVFAGQRSARPSSGAVASSGARQGSSTRWKVDGSLDPGEVYTAFVRVARPWGFALLWSPWASRVFDVEQVPTSPSPPDDLSVVPVTPDPVDPSVSPGEFSLRVTWPTLFDGAFGVDPFGLAPFGGGSSMVTVESADDPDGPWVRRGTFGSGTSDFRDRFVGFDAERWYRLRAALEVGDELVTSAASHPVPGVLSPPVFTAAITSVDTNRSVEVLLRDLPLTPTLGSRMEVMAAADMEVSTAQGQPPVPGFEGRLFVRPDEYDDLRELLRDGGTLVWRDNYRYRFPFVWSSDLDLVPTIGRADTPHEVDAQMTVVDWPQGVH